MNDSPATVPVKAPASTLSARELEDLRMCWRQLIGVNIGNAVIEDGTFLFTGKRIDDGSSVLVTIYNPDLRIEITERRA
jgi:hypothetical protein